MYSVDDRKCVVQQIEENQKQQLMKQSFLPRDKNNFQQYEIEKLLTIPYGIVELENECFMGVNYLKSIVIPQTVKIIGKKCFAQCNNLSKVTLPSNLTMFDSSWFQDCPKLTKLEIPNTVKRFNPRAFTGYENLIEINIPTPIHILPARCFFQCTSLRVIHGISQIKSFGKDCFDGCISLNQETIAEINKIQSKKPLKSKQGSFGKYGEEGNGLIKREEGYDDISQLSMLTNNIPEFDEDEEIITKEECQLLEKWSNRNFGAILFDSNVDDWSEKTSVFASRISYKKHLMFIVKELSGECFGCFLDCEIGVCARSAEGRKMGGMETFLFNLRSNGRLDGPKKFEVINPEYPYVLYDLPEQGLITFGKGRQIMLYKKNKRYESHCTQRNNVFNYHGYKMAIIGKGQNSPFTPIRIVVYQMGEKIDPTITVPVYSSRTSKSDLVENKSENVMDVSQQQIKEKQNHILEQIKKEINLTDGDNNNKDFSNFETNKSNFENDVNEENNENEMNIVNNNEVNHYNHQEEIEIETIEIHNDGMNVMNNEIIEINDEKENKDELRFPVIGDINIIEDEK